MIAKVQVFVLGPLEGILGQSHATQWSISVAKTETTKIKQLLE